MAVVSPLIDYGPANNRSYNLPRQLPTIKWSVPRLRARLRRLKRPLLLRIKNRHIAKRSAPKRSPPAKIEASRGPRGKQFNDPAERNPLRHMQPRDRQRQRCFKPDNPKCRPLKLHFFFVRGMRSMIG